MKLTPYETAVVKLIADGGRRCQLAIEYLREAKRMAEKAPRKEFCVCLDEAISQLERASFYIARECGRPAPRRRKGS